MKFLITSLLLISVTMSASQETGVVPPIPEEEGVHVGELRGSEHSISGSLYAVDENVLLLKRFEYDGEAQDAFFWVGTSGDRPTTDGTILPYPFSGIYYQSEDQNAPILFGIFNGSSDIRLTLPEEMKVTDLKWFSIWSRAGKKSFGEVLFPAGFTLDKKYPTGTSVNSGFSNSGFINNNPTTHTDTFSNTELPPPLLSGNVHDPRRVDNWSADHDQGAQPEAEAEPETNDHDDDHHDDEHERFQPRRNGASNVFSSLAVVVLSTVLAKLL
jgi:hypothetical protein